MAFVLNGSCARRCARTWPAAGSVGSASTARCRTTRPSPRIGIVGSAIATCCANCLRKWCSDRIAEGLVTGAAFAFDANLIAADADKQCAVAGSDEVDWEGIARKRRSVREYLNTLHEAAWGAASETVPKFIAKSDPAPQWTGVHKGHAFFAYANESRDYPRRRTARQPL